MMPLLEYLISIYVYIVIFVASIFFFTFQVICSITLYTLDPKRFVVGRIFRRCGTFCISMNPMWDFKVVGELPKKWPERTICVSNHCSLTDVGLISLLPWEMKWLAKSSMLFLPFIGWSMWLAGDIMIHRGDKNSAKTSMQKCKQWLDKGCNIMIFPEGTRSKSGEMQEFRDGAFRLAIETQCEILPLAVAGTYKCLPAGSWKMSPAKGRCLVGTPISTKGMTLEDVEKLKLMARRQIEELQAKLKPHCD